MSNEEIKQRALELSEHLERLPVYDIVVFPHTQRRLAIEDAMFALVSQAYEEAAQRLERRADYVESHMPNHNMAVQELREMAATLRALSPTPSILESAVDAS